MFAGSSHASVTVASVSGVSSVLRLSLALESEGGGLALESEGGEEKASLRLTSTM